MSTLFGKSAKRRKRARAEKAEAAPSLVDRLNDDDDGNVTRDMLLGEESAKKQQQSEEEEEVSNNNTQKQKAAASYSSSTSSFADLGLATPLQKTCAALGFTKPTAIQQALIPFLLSHSKENLLALAPTGTGKTAAFVLPLLQHLVADPYGIFAVILTPTRELAKQIHQQVLALGSCYNSTSCLITGGMDLVRQACALDQQRPHFCVATPGRLAALLRGPEPRPRLQFARYLVLDEADRLLQTASSGSGFEADIAEVLLHTTTAQLQAQASSSKRKRQPCQTILLSATMTSSLTSLQEMACHGRPLKQFVIRDDNNSDSDEEEDEEELDDEDSSTNGDKECSSETRKKKAEATPTIIPKIPAGLKQEYIFMPARVRDAYLLTTIRALMANGGRTATAAAAAAKQQQHRRGGKNKKKWSHPSSSTDNTDQENDDDDDDDNVTGKARSAIIFVATCERAALVSGILSHVGVPNVALHSLLSQNRRLAALQKFKSQHVRVLVATDVASRGLDLPSTDLVVNASLPRHAATYVHRVGRTARAGRRGRAVSLVDERQVRLVHAAEQAAGRVLEKCTDVSDDMALELLGPTTKAARLTKMKLSEIGFDELVAKFKQRKARDRKERERIEKALRKM